MREIKFRAWLPGVRRMIPDELTISSEMISLEDSKLTQLLEPDFQIEDDEVWDKENNVVMRVLCGEDWYWIERQYYELMQYTGLKDKNGKEIYEGDVMVFLDERYQVVYFDTYTAFMLQHSNGNDLKNIYGSEEVIGNIYENPELIKDTA